MLSKLSELRLSPWRSFRSSAIVIVIGLALCSIGPGQAQPDAYRTLAGLNGVYVFVLAGDRALDENGPPETRLTDVVKDQLRRAGIPVSVDPGALGTALLMFKMRTDTASDLTLLPDLDYLPIDVFWYARICVAQGVVLKRDRRIGRRLTYAEMIGGSA